jgi:hypothetical protein
MLLASILWNISDYLPGLIGVSVIGASIAASIQARRKPVPKQ